MKIGIHKNYNFHKIYKFHTVCKNHKIGIENLWSVGSSFVRSCSSLHYWCTCKGCNITPRTSIDNIVCFLIVKIIIFWLTLHGKKYHCDFCPIFF